ncbi:MAG: type I-U CRISPR-associated protein Cas8c [Caulobacteraceae bacterium]|nr:type I-U CRISPR-associated protein Cas8c [Caulobacteraceae bacterium]
MVDATIPVDLRNPGQVFGCLGLMEAAEVFCGPAEGVYAWVEGETRATFTVSVAGDADPIREIVEFLTTAEARALNALVPNDAGVRHSAVKWHVVTEAFEGGDWAIFPFDVPDSPATLPVKLIGPKGTLLISHWGDDPVSMGRDNVKFWAGSGGYPGAALARDALALVASLGGNALTEAVADPFNLAAPQSSSFGFDWRRSYVPLEAGFSPNAHGNIKMVGYPLVELLAAIGLQNARPERPDRGNKLAYRYAVSNARLPTLFARAVLGGQSLGFNVRRFRMQLDWPGQEGQARCIIDSREE